MRRLPASSRVCWSLVDRLANTLEPDERDAVRGDIDESGASGVEALRGVLGLVVRREAGRWREFGPWLSLIAVIVPLGLLLSHVSRWWADSSAIYAFLYVDNWTWYFLKSPGARGELAVIGVSIFLRCLTLVGWSWTAGFVLGVLSRRTLWITGTCFCLVVIGGTLGTITTARANPFNSAVFAQPFYRVVFPGLLRMMFVLLPAVWAMRRSVRRDSLPLMPTLLGAAAIAMLTVWTARSVEYSVIFDWHLTAPNPGLDRVMGTADDPRPLRLLPLVMLWPVVYMVATTGRRRWRRGAAGE